MKYTQINAFYILDMPFFVFWNVFIQAKHIFLDSFSFFSSHFEFIYVWCKLRNLLGVWKLIAIIYIQMTLGLFIKGVILPDWTKRVVFRVESLEPIMTNLSFHSFLRFPVSSKKHKLMWKSNLFSSAGEEQNTTKGETACQQNVETTKRCVACTYSPRCYTEHAFFREVTSFFPVMTVVETDDDSKAERRHDVYMCLVKQIWVTRCSSKQDL